MIQREDWERRRPGEILKSGLYDEQQEILQAVVHEMRRLADRRVARLRAQILEPDIEVDWIAVYKQSFQAYDDWKRMDWATVAHFRRAE